MKYQHKTVLLYEAINSLNIHKNGIYIDGTFGCGGHSRLILSKIGEKGLLLAIDRDYQAVSIAKNINDPRFSIIHGPFSALFRYVEERGLIGKIDGILFDLGISSLQLDNAERGFSFMKDGPLDMRMNQMSGRSVSELLQITKEYNIAWVLKNFGEERFSKRIAHAIMKRNRNQPITRTRELVKIIATATPIKNKFKHIATRVFQAMRIWVNSELDEINSALKSSLQILSPRGRLSVITFHSLEDRIVKHFFYRNSRVIQIPSKLPITEKQLRKISNCHLQILGKLMPSKEEIEKNPRSRSAILRFSEKIGNEKSNQDLKENEEIIKKT